MTISICLVTNINTDLAGRVAILVAKDDSSDAAAEVPRIGCKYFMNSSGEKQNVFIPVKEE